MNRLKELRKSKGLSLKEVAKEVGLAESQLSFYENGKRRPRDEKVWLELARFYNVSVGYLLGNIDIEVPKVTEGTHQLWKALEERALEKKETPDEDIKYITSLLSLESSFETSLELLHSIAMDDATSNSFTNSLRNYTHSYMMALHQFGPDVAIELSKSLDILSNIIGLRSQNMILKDDHKKNPEDIIDEFLEGKRKISESLDKLFIDNFKHFKEDDKNKIPESYISKLKKETEE